MKVTISTLSGSDANFGTWLQLISLYKYLEEEFGVESSLWRKPGIGKQMKCREAFEHDFEYFGLKVSDPKDSDFIIIGSDVVLYFEASWYTDEWFKKCVQFPNIDDRKKIIFSGSSVNSSIKNYKWYDMFLKNIKYLAFREKTTYENNMFPEHPNWTYVLDPTFLHDPEYYLKMAEKPDMEIPNDFSVSYFPHKDIFKSSLNIPENTIELYNNPAIGIREFLWMMKNCKEVYTNAFHGTVFGIMFGKRVLNDKCHTMKTKNILDEFKISVNDEHCLIYDGETVKRQIVKQRERSKHFLECAFSNKDLLFRKKSFSCYAKDKKVRDSSASGGFCAVSASKIFEEKGIVYGAAYTDGFRHVKTVRIDNMQDYFNLVSKSKYSYCQDCDFNLVKDDLESEKQVLFTGCPCQIKHLKQFLGQDYDNLITVDLLCHGYSEPKYLEQFIDEMQAEQGSKVISLDMRSRHRCLCLLLFNNGKTLECDNIFKLFVNNDTMMQMCKECNMHRGSNMSDITVGDFWGYKKDRHPEDFSPKLGTNIVYVHTQKGFKFINSLQINLNIL